MNVGFEMAQIAHIAKGEKKMVEKSACDTEHKLIKYIFSREITFLIEKST